MRHSGARRRIRTITVRILSPLPLPVGLHARKWWVPRDLNSDDHKGQRFYRPPQPCRICLTPETLAEAERLERSRPVLHWTGGLANRCHTFRRRFRTGTRATIRTPRDGFGSHLLSQEHPSINLAESEGIEPSRFIAVALFSRQFPDHSRPLSVSKNW